MVDGFDEHLSLEQRVKSLEDKLDEADAWDLQQQIFKIDEKLNIFEISLTYQGIIIDRMAFIADLSPLLQNREWVSKARNAQMIFDKHFNWASRRGNIAQ